MASVLFIAVREDIDRAEALADMFEMAGVAVVSPFNAETLAACDAAICVWSRASARSTAFLNAADRALASGKGLSACLAGAPASVIDSPSAFDLSKWRGAPDSGLLDDFFYAAYAKLMAAQRASVAVKEKARAAPIVVAAMVANDNPTNPHWKDADWEEAEWVDMSANAAPDVEAAQDAEVEDEPEANPSLGAGWLAPLPEGPLPTSFTAKRYTPPPKPQRGLFRSVLRTLSMFVLLSAAAFAGSLARAPQQQAAQPDGVAALVTQADAQGDDGAIEGMADVGPPVWLREPASAPEMADQG